MSMWKRPSVVIPLLLSVWLFGVCHGAFSSSFGVAKAESAYLITTPAPTAKPCSRQAECIAVSSSSCVRTHYDTQTRCLCGDNSAPINGQCEKQTKTLYHACENSDDCNDGLICSTPNVTAGVPPHLRMLGPRDTICLCDEDNGFREKDHTCSGADILKTSSFAILLVSCIRKIITS